MNRPRGVIVVLALLATAGVSVALGARLWVGRLPDPASADREGLVRWLVVRDMADEPQAVRGMLVRRLEGELQAGIEYNELNEALSEEHKSRFWSNVDLLVEEWLTEEAAEYAAVESELRVERLEERMEQILSWPFIDQLLEKKKAEHGGQLPVLLKCQNKVEAWIEAAAAEDAENMRALWSDARLLMMRRAMSGGLTAMPTSET